MRRGFLAIVLLGAAFIPGRAVTAARDSCAGRPCARAGRILWAEPLPGDWRAAAGELGTVPSSGQAYAAAGDGVAAVGDGTAVTAYSLASGRRLWTAQLAGYPAGSAIVSVRAWPGVVTAGLMEPATGAGAGSRTEIVLSARSGSTLRAYPAAAYGGAVAADAARSVIVGTTAVTGYDNSTGRVLWSRDTGGVAQAWRLDGDDLFVTVSVGGYLGASPVTALRRIDVQTGAEQIVVPAAKAFAGSFSGAVGGVVLFSGAAGLSGYSGTSGRLLWQHPGVVPEMVDQARQTLYVASGNALTGINPVTGVAITRASALGSGLYAIRSGNALGLNEGGLGEAWGYSLASRTVIWTATPLPWPHFFVDLSGVGGSADPDNSTVILAACAKVGPAAAGQSGPRCLRPELVAIGR